MAAFVEDSVAAAAADAAELAALCCPSTATASCINERLGIGRTGQHDLVFSGNEKFSIYKKKHTHIRLERSSKFLKNL